LRRVTVLGDLDVHRLDASEALVGGLVTVADVQTGCFRFGAANAGSTLPHPYRSTELVDTAPLFHSRSFGDPEYAQISAAGPPVLRSGAENGSEIGAFSGLLGPIKADGLRAKVDEFMPFGLIPVLIAET